MRALAGLLLALLLMAGCTTERDAPADATASAAPEDALRVVGVWQGAELVETDEPLILTLSDDNTYVVADACLELPGRWELLESGRLALTPEPQENGRCSENRTWPTISETYDIEGDRLMPTGDGSGFTRLGG